MDKDVAIKVENLSKTFRIPRENRDTIRERLFNLSKKLTYETYIALDHVTFQIRKGEFFGIIGRNGSGKSTLLKILAGIYTPDDGHIVVNGQISPFLELGVGFNPELSGKDNIYLNGTILGLTKREIDKRYKRIVEFSELERFINVKMKNYSSGMHVRLAFSVAINANKDILLMDEVLAVGDTNFQSKCLTEFLNYKKEGKTVILVTHELNILQRYCERALLLRNGRITHLGASRDVASAYVAQNMSDEEKRLRKIKKAEETEVERQIVQRKPVEEKYYQEEEKTGSDKTVRDIQKREDLQRQNRMRIIKIELSNKANEVKSVFKTGEDIRVRVYFEAKEDDPLPFNFSLSLYSQENYHILGINTLNDKIEVDKYRKQGYFEVIYPAIHLNSNLYYFKAGIYEDKVEKVLDIMDKSGEFKVFNDSLNPGIVQMEYIWG